MMKRTLSLPLFFVLAFTVAVSYVTNLHGSGVLKRNVADLITLSDMIIVGKVVAVSDGLDGNTPFTEVTIEVSQTIKGNVTGQYTFRQFGLLAPKDMGNGLVNANVTPPGWPKYRAGEQVMLFLYKAASITGLRTTVGLFQGKFIVRGGELTNAIHNLGLFENVSIGPRRLSASQQAMLEIKKGRLDAASFISFVSKAVNEQWFE